RAELRLPEPSPCPALYRPAVAPERIDWETGDFLYCRIPPSGGRFPWTDRSGYRRSVALPTQSWSCRCDHRHRLASARGISIVEGLLPGCLQGWGKEQRLAAPALSQPVRWDRRRGSCFPHQPDASRRDRRAAMLFCRMIVAAPRCRFAIDHLLVQRQID